MSDNSWELGGFYFRILLQVCIDIERVVLYWQMK